MDTDTTPITTSFTTLSKIFTNIDAPPPWPSERARFQNWGTSAGLTSSPNPLFSNREVRKEVLVALYRLEESFTDESQVVTKCGLMRKKGTVGGAFKKGFKKLTGKSSSHLPPAAGNVDPTQKWVIQFPEIWTAKLTDVTMEINLLSILVPVDDVGTVTQGMGGMAISNQQAPPPAATSAFSEPSEAEQERIYDELEKLEEVIKSKDQGVLNTILSPSTNYSPRVRASVYYDENDHISKIWHDDVMGYIKLGHGSFELYHRRRYMKPSTSKYSTDTDEDGVLFDVESNPKYEHVYPGTCTIEGFGMEAWDYELAFGRPRDNTVFVSYATLPDVSAKQLIRRIDELQSSIASKFGWAPKKERHDLEELYGNMGTTYVANIPDNSPLRIGDFYQQLNRRDIFTDFTSISSIATQWSQPRAEGVMGIWNFLYQLILAKELHFRLLSIADGSYSGFTARVLASLTVADLWLSHVKIELSEPSIPPEVLHKAKTPEETAKMEEKMQDGHKAAKLSEWQMAVDYYTEAMAIDNSLAMNSAFRASAYMALDKPAFAHDDATAATKLNPKDKLGWSALGDANVGLGNLTRAKEAYQTAFNLSGGQDDQIKKKLDDVTSKINARIDVINKQIDPSLAITLEKQHNDEKYDINGRSVEFHSKIHERQVEGLIMFAERMKWPWVHEVREAAEDVYSKIRGGAVTPFHVVDWIFGLTLPGEWMALKIMSAMVLLTDSVKGQGIAPFYDCGFVTEQKSYHRIRNVLGRVLGCLPGVTSLCGWIGPCPPVTFDPPLAKPLGVEKKGMHIRVKARRVGLVDPPDPHDNVIRIGGGGAHKELRPKPEDIKNFDSFAAEIRDPANWVLPAVPKTSYSISKFQGIVLKALPLEAGVDTSDPDTVERNTEYRASINFIIDGRSVSYSLFTNPVFVTPPPCIPETRGAHEIHKRELKNFSNVVEAEKLKDYTLGDEEIVIINATGDGAEAVARAWCAERGRAAIIRRRAGPCLTCTVNCAQELKQKVIIWAYS
ncbi:uncharacterized protein DFL_009869 [Arthrobotrys flagrans]|uniref:Uncharacterized protein n=1 Tax=Arthrobotrys flagrans TaxID=97331 RepID=A0A436ZT62_ARTFL|nr:hypothetical protein DFL_009869 [Arthrobotrys flagrans]